jgi:hypothetical protein
MTTRTSTAKAPSRLQPKTQLRSVRLADAVNDLRTEVAKPKPEKSRKVTGSASIPADQASSGGRKPAALKKAAGAASMPPVLEVAVTDARTKALVKKRAAPGQTATAPAQGVETLAPPVKERTGTRKALVNLKAETVADITKQVPPPTTRGRPLSRSDIRIFQIYYDPQQQSSLDPEFQPFDNIGNSSRLLEFSRLANSKEVKGSKLWGAVSWKFGQKTGISGKDFKQAILSNPGHDLYFCNPHPDTEALYHNMWIQGETAHPNFLPLCTEIFDVAGLPRELLNSIQPSTSFAAANYFAATPDFWRAYIAFISRVLIAADRHLSPTSRAILYSSTADKHGMHAEATYIPFLIERLLTVFLRTEGGAFKAFKLALPEREKTRNVHLRLLTEMKDVACRTKSNWLAACWINYRNLYLVNAYGDAWARKYLKQITPSEVAFAPDNGQIVSGGRAK